MFSKVQNLEYYDWLVACACISDFATEKVPEFMSKTFKRYNETFNKNEELIKKTKIWDLQKTISLSLIYFENNLKEVYNLIGKKFGEIGHISKYSKIVEKEIGKKKKEFYKNREIFENIYFWELKTKYSILAILNNYISVAEKDKVFIIISKDKRVYKISARNQEGDVDLPNLLKLLVNDFKDSSAGGFFPVKYLPEFKKRIKELSEKI